jgi:hypothetical protein
MTQADQADTFDKFFLRPSASYRATAEADLLDGMQRRQECVSFPELGNDCCRDRQPVIAVGRRIDCSHKSGAAIVSRCSPETEVSHQRSAVIETRLYSMRIEGVEARVDTELIRKIVDHSRGGCSLSHKSRPVWRIVQS